MPKTEASPNLSVAFNLPPQRALDYFRSKGLATSTRALSFTAADHAKAFTVAGVLKAEVLADIRTAMDKALAEGKTFSTFVDELEPKLRARGWWGNKPHDTATGEVLPGRGMTPYRLDTVFRTNAQSAYMAGRYQAMLENADRRPWWEYVAVMDNRTRPSHAALNGRVFRYDDPAWAALYPPNGYRCRCRVRARSEGDVARENIATSSGGALEKITVDLGKRGKVPLTGWRDPSTGKLFTPDIGFDHSPAGTLGVDIALARTVQALKSPKLREQTWQHLNNNPQRLVAWKDKIDQVVATRGQTPRPGASVGQASVLGFVNDQVAAFSRRMEPTVEPARVLAITDKALLHADSADHLVDGIALSADQYVMLPGIVSKPDAVFWDFKHSNLVYTLDLADGSVIYLAATLDKESKKIGRIDAMVNAYRLPIGKDGADRLLTVRYARMGKERGAP